MNKDELPIDFEAVELLKRVQTSLAHALNSLAGKSTEGGASYLVWCSAHVNKAFGGYIVLRECRLIHASKLLFRPVLEAMFYGRASVRRKEFWLEKAYSELLEDARFVAQDGTNRKTIETNAKKEFDRIKQLAVKNQPSYRSVQPKEVSAKSAAESAGLAKAYQIDYRLYCQFMHGALRAASGDLDALTDERDTPLMIWSALVLCEELNNHTPAALSDLASLWREFNELPPACAI